MSGYSVSSPARFCGERDAFETLDTIVDIDNGRIELVSEDKKDVIRLDMIGVATLEETLHEIVNSKQFQTALGEKIVEHRGRYNAMNASAL